MKDTADIATEQLRGIYTEIGGLDYEWLLDELKEIDYLENPAPSYKKAIQEAYSGEWEDFVFIWKSYHLFRIAKRMWRKFERIAKKYPNFDRYVEQVVEEGNEDRKAKQNEKNTQLTA